MLHHTLKSWLKKKPLLHSMHQGPSERAQRGSPLALTASFPAKVARHCGAALPQGDRVRRTRCTGSVLQQALHLGRSTHAWVAYQKGPGCATSNGHTACQGWCGASVGARLQSGYCLMHHEFAWLLFGCKSKQVKLAQQPQPGPAP